jgi:glycosyltransferase involved in cell wall biosynthesis
VTSRLHVAALFEYPVLNGAEHSWLANLPFLQGHGVRFTAIAPEVGELAESLTAANIEIVPFSCHDRRGQRRELEELRAELGGALRRTGGDVLHANSLSMSRLAGPVAKAANLPSLGHLRDIVTISHRAMSDVNLNRRILAVSAATLRWHIDAGLRPDIANILANGVDLQRFAPGRNSHDLLDELGLDHSCKIVGNVGQIGLRKAQDILLDAAEQLIQRYSGVHFVLVGQRNSDKQESLEFEQQLRRRVRRQPLRGRVHLLGRRRDVPELMRAFDVVVHSARQEPLGRVLLEAAATGRPIVATNVGGTSEIFPVDSAAAVLVPADDPLAIVQAVDPLLTDESRRRRLGAAARHRCEAAFGAETAAGGLLKHYRELVGDQ